jgi:hypothetical protein
MATAEKTFKSVSSEDVFLDGTGPGGDRTQAFEQIYIAVLNAPGASWATPFSLFSGKPSFNQQIAGERIVRRG